MLLQTGWLLPTTGIPCEVPVPKKVISNIVKLLI